MNKIRVLTILVIGLILMNIGLTAFIVFNKPSPPLREGPRKIIIEKLGFDDKQQKEYAALIQWHQDEITKTENEIRDLKNQLYILLKEDGHDVAKDSLINELMKVQGRIENIHYTHFLDIRKVCREDQIPKYNELTNEIARLFSHPPIKSRKK